MKNKNYNLLLISLKAQKCLCQVTSFASQCSTLYASLTNYWSFDNNVNDLKGGKTLSNPSDPTLISFVNDRFGNFNSALILNRGYYQLPSGTYFQVDYTLSLWVKPFAWASDNDRIISFWETGGNLLVFSLKNSLQGPYIAMPSGTNFELNINLNLCRWQHLVFSLSGTSATIYIDGVQVYQNTYQSPPLNVVYTANWFGNFNGENGNGAPMSVFDDVMIFSRALTSAEIQLLASYTDSTVASLANYWSFDNSVNDLVGGMHLSNPTGMYFYH